MRTPSPPVAILGLLLAGCIPNTDTLDEACPRELPGAKHLGSNGPAFLTRVSCFRRFVKLNATPVKKLVQAAADRHKLYLENADATEEGIRDYFVEFKNEPYFTGTTVYDRLLESGGWDGARSVLVYEIVWFQGSTPTELDNLFAGPYIRDPLLQPGLYAAAYADLDLEAAPLNYTILIFQLPSDRRVRRPVIYPKDGQVDVHNAYQGLGFEGDPLLAVPINGFPITITVGSWEAKGSRGEGNAYDLQILRSTLYESDTKDEVPLITVPPGNYPIGPMYSTASFAPMQPLELGVRYTLEADLTWNVIEGTKTVTTSFRTAETAYVAGFGPDSTGGPPTGAVLPDDTGDAPDTGAPALPVVPLTAGIPRPMVRWTHVDAATGETTTGGDAGDVLPLLRGEPTGAWNQASPASSPSTTASQKP